MKFAYVDSHVHFWDPGALPYPWLSSHPAIAGAHLPARLRGDLAEAFPSALVFVQAECDRSRYLEEVQWVETMSQTEPLVAAIVAFAPMDQGESTIAILEQLSRRPLVRGVRHLIQDDPDSELCRRGPFIDGVRFAGQKGLCFDLCVREQQLPAVVDLVRACPNTRFVLDHAGKPGVASGRLDPWATRMGELADLPNVVCKLSGLVTEASPTAPLDLQLRPYVDHLLRSFGPSRLLFGSDWPVVKLASSAPKWLDIARALVEDLAWSEGEAIFSENAKRTYRLF
jgi:predicted TIM-barrel fold metal-dependent hydrolase